MSDQLDLLGWRPPPPSPAPAKRRVEPVERQLERRGIPYAPEDRAQLGSRRIVPPNADGTPQDPEQTWGAKRVAAMRRLGVASPRVLGRIAAEEVERDELLEHIQAGKRLRPLDWARARMLGYPVTLVNRGTGRPATLDEDTFASLLDMLVAGTPMTIASTALGLKPGVIRDWVGDPAFPEFAAAVTEAEAKGIAAHVQVVHTAGLNGDWRASAHSLQHRAPDHFAAKRQVQLDAKVESSSEQPQGVVYMPPPAEGGVDAWAAGAAQALAKRPQLDVLDVDFDDEDEL